MDARSAADGAGYVGEASEALQHANVWVSPEVSGAADLQASLQAQVGDASIGVAVFSDNVSLEASGDQIVADLAGSTSYDTIIVAVGDDLWAGSHTLDEGEALRIANEAEGSADGLGAALTETVQGVQAAQEAAGAGGGGAGGAGGAGGWLVVVLVVAVLAAAAATTIGVIRSRRRRAAGGDRRVPDQIRRHVATLRSLAASYAQVGSSGNAGAARAANDLAGIATNVEELFTRLERSGGGSQRGTALVEYDATLRKLTAAVDRDYLLDILTHPQLWDDPEERVREVQGAVEAVSGELVKNIKQVNARRGLLFQVSLDGMIGKRKELQEWERAFEEAARDGESHA
ncbi:hypothetical protein ET445_17045 [Agromyces protaetiae]|uniref:Uncharacterized protein n=1 Tax=Agromyces protaetiae TaxID=2509455 RepID=A0A4P6FFU8_9MICO|nr:hypothetical protein [Agromyces protaetiae]QAY74786.1 hypothetical protein ET445_17045 [Agromyces protaetiae]